MPDQDNVSGSDEVEDNTENVCRDFLRNVCKRGSRCRFLHPEASMSDPGVSKNEFVFCHDFQNKECVRPNCKFLHCSRQDEEYYKKCGELPSHLQQKVAANMGVLAAELSNSKEVPICRDFLKGECLRKKCKFRHLQREFDFNDPFDPKLLSIDRMLVAQSIPPGMRCRDPLTSKDVTRPFEDLISLVKSQRADGTEIEVYDFATTPVHPVEQHMLEQEAVLLRRRVEELKKQASVLVATNEVLLAQNAQFRQHRANMRTLNSVAATRAMGPIVANYNPGLAQTHTTLSSYALQPHLVCQHGRMTASIQTAQVGAAN